MPRRPLDCGIDIGSTNVKVVLVADDTEIVSTRAIPSPRVDDGLGIATDPLALVDRLEDLIIEAWREAAQGAPLRSLTAAGVGEDGVGLTADVTPTGLAIPWFDGRATTEAAELSAIDRVARSGHAITPDKTAAKWLWTHRHRPTEHAASRLWVSLTDFPAAYWTGRPLMSASLAPRTGCFDVRGRTWIGELLAAARAPGLPPVLSAGTALGPIIRGRLRAAGAADAATVVAVGGHDHPMAASVIRALDPSAVVDSLGTANLLYDETLDLPVGRCFGDLSVSIPPDGRDAFALLGVLEFAASLHATGATAAEIATFLSQNPLPGAPPGANWDLHAGDAPLDIRLRRAIERESLKARDMLDDMRRLGAAKGPVHVTGGWSRSPGFMALRASILGRRLHVIDAIELAAFGAARFGAYAATGRWISGIGTSDIQTFDPIVGLSDVYAGRQRLA